MTKKKKSKLRKLWQERYFGPLLQNKVEYDYLKIFPWINLVLSIIFYYLGVIGEKNLNFKFIQMFFLVSIIINIFSLVIVLVGRLNQFFRSLAYCLLGLSFTTTLLWSNLIGLLMFVTRSNSGSIEALYHSSRSLFYIILIMLLFIVSCFLYTWYYLPKNQGKRWKINQWETYGVGKKDKKSQFKLNFLITLGIVVIVPAFLTGYIQNLFGLFLGVLVTITVTALVVDSFYAAYYSLKHPDYN